ncbi:MAG: hypothetical protein QME81_06065 [bacterium]|nr:hypothetical protein [bacterium]
MGDIEKYIEILVVLIPVIVAICLIFKFVVPKHPKIGIGLAVGAGIFGAYLVNRKLKKAFNVEKKIAEHNENMAQFKEIQKTRNEVVMANKSVIDTLKKQREKLAKKGNKYQTEIDIIDAELQDRQTLNKKLIKNAGEFVETSKTRSEKRRELLRRYKEESGFVEIVQPERESIETESPASTDIEINGYRLLEV